MTKKTKPKLLGELPPLPLPIHRKPCAEHLYSIALRYVDGTATISAEDVRHLEAAADFLTDDSRPPSSGDISPEMALLESIAIARSCLQANQQMARTLHSAVVLMTLPPFKRDNATVNPDGSLTINAKQKDHST